MNVVTAIADDRNTAPRAAAAAPGDAQSRATRFLALYEQHFDLVWRNLGRLGVPESGIADAAQDVFLVVHRRLDDYDGRCLVTTWLLGIVLRVASDHRRTLRRKGGHTELREANVAGSGPDPFEAAAASEAGRLVDQVLDTMDDDKRAVFVLAELEQLTAREIAEALAVNANTVATRLRAARSEFHQAAARLRARGREKIR